MNPEPMLTVDQLTVSWEGLPVVSDISFTLGAGRTLCLIGRSGSGKTTLFHALAGLTEPDEGTIALEGADVTGKPGAIGYMLQKDLLLAQRTILDNVILPLVIKGTGKEAARERALPLLESFGLAEAAAKYPRQLSGGMGQRAALLRTYLTGSPVMLMDEPFSALDALTRQDMQSWFLSMAQELSLSTIVVTHDINEALALADEILVLGPAVLGERLPSTITARIPIDVPRTDREAFLASADAARLRQRILDAL